MQQFSPFCCKNRYLWWGKSTSSLFLRAIQHLSYDIHGMRTWIKYLPLSWIRRSGTRARVLKYPMPEVSNLWTVEVISLQISAEAPGTRTLPGIQRPTWSLGPYSVLSCRVPTESVADRKAHRSIPDCKIRMESNRKLCHQNCRYRSLLGTHFSDGGMRNGGVNPSQNSAAAGVKAAIASHWRWVQIQFTKSPLVLIRAAGPKYLTPLI